MSDQRPKRSVPIDALRAFIAVVNARGFTRAAFDLGRSQPTVSLQVKKLEELCGAPLFVRGSNLKLTRVGQVCLESGLALLNANDEMIAHIDKLGNISRPLRVGLPSELHDLVWPRLLSDPSGSTALHGVELSFDTSEKLLKSFERDELDVTFIFTLGESALHARRSWDVGLQWCAARDYPLRPDNPVKLVTGFETSVFHRVAVDALGKAGREFEVVLSSPDFRVRSSAIKAGVGVGLLLDEAIDSQDVRVIPNDEIEKPPDLTLNGLYADRPGQSEFALTTNIAAALDAVWPKRRLSE